MSGATSRRRGHDWERQVAKFLTYRLGVEVLTTRAIDGGHQHGADLATRVNHQWRSTVLGWSVECKASTNGHRVTEWMRQAERQSRTGQFCVIAKVHNRPITEGTVYMPGGQWRSLAGEVTGVTAPSLEPSRVVSVSLEAWADLVRLRDELFGKEF